MKTYVIKITTALNESAIEERYYTQLHGDITTEHLKYAHQFESIEDAQEVVDFITDDLMMKGVQKYSTIEII